MNKRAFERARMKANALKVNPCSEVVLKGGSTVVSMDLAEMEYRASVFHDEIAFKALTSWRMYMAEELCVMPSSLTDEEVQGYKLNYYKSGFGG